MPKHSVPRTARADQRRAVAHQQPQLTQDLNSYQSLEESAECTGSSMQNPFNSTVFFHDGGVHHVNSFEELEGCVEMPLQR